MVLPNRNELDDSINSQKLAQLEIENALAKDEFTVNLVKTLIGATGKGLQLAGIPFAGTGADLAKMAVDVVVRRGL